MNRACYELATATPDLNKVREQLIAQELFIHPAGERARTLNTGVLSEIDAYIALLDLRRQRANVIVLPSPSQFEQLSEPANADFTVFDKSLWQVRGVQVKAQVGSDRVTQYDRGRVTLLDGARDLQNTRAMRTSPVKSDRRTVAGRA
ncbi:MAG: hypothetical protein ACTHW5_01595 [Microbacterium sp.]